MALPHAGTRTCRSSTPCGTAGWIRGLVVPGYGGGGAKSAAVRLCLRGGTNGIRIGFLGFGGISWAWRRRWTVAREVWAHLRGKRKKPENLADTYFYRAPPIGTIFRKNP